jgi:hypothetical protein
MGGHIIRFIWALLPPEAMRYDRPARRFAPLHDMVCIAVTNQREGSLVLTKRYPSYDHAINSIPTPNETTNSVNKEIITQRKILTQSEIETKDAKAAVRG